LNFAAASAGPGTLADRINQFTAAYIFERDLLHECRNRRLSRVVQLLEHGEVRVKDAGFLKDVPYLILELADGDIRAFQSTLNAFDAAWALRVIKHVIEGVEQLHLAQTAHQDLKPSNVLTQKSGTEMKLGDLGRADRVGQHGPWSSLKIPGAIAYAPPEQHYGHFTGTWEERPGEGEDPSVGQQREIVEWIEEKVEHRGQAENGRAAVEIIMATYESARLHEVTALPLRTMASPLEVMIEAGDLPVERPGRYDIRAFLLRGEDMQP